MGGIGWIIVFAILLTPTVSEGTNASIAPAIFGLIFGVLTKDQALVWAKFIADSLCGWVLVWYLVIYGQNILPTKPQHVVNKKTSPL